MLRRTVLKALSLFPLSMIPLSKKRSVSRGHTWTPPVEQQRIFEENKKAVGFIELATGLHATGDGGFEMTHITVGLSKDGSLRIIDDQPSQPGD